MSSSDPTEPLQNLVQRAQKGDQTVLPALRLMLDEHPEIWHQAGDLARQAELAWIYMIAGQDLFVRESLERQIVELKGELAGDDPSPLEKLLVARITACWLALHHAEAIYPRMQGGSPAQHVAAQKRINAGQTRYLQAIRVLATVRKLLRPALSPVEIASRFGGSSGGFRSARRDVLSVGVAVEN